MEVEKVTLGAPRPQTAAADMCHEQIYIYPVKSLRPVSVESAAIGRFGFLNDRVFMLLKVHKDPETSDVIRLQNMHVSEFPKMALFVTSLEAEDGPDHSNPSKIMVTYTPPASVSRDKPSHADVRDQIGIPFQPATQSLEGIQIEMHSSPTPAYNMGAPYNDWFSARFGHDVILAFVGPNSRAVLGNLPPNAAGALPAPQPTVSSLFNSLRSMIPLSQMTPVEDKDDSRIAFQDCAHFLVVTTESLADVSARLPANLTMDVTKFRPNIVLSGAGGGAWAEDYWGELAIADDIVVLLTANCTRCQSINVDYATGAPGTDESGTVLKKLQRDRRVDMGVKYSPCFGRYGFRRKEDVGKRVSVGMKVAVTKVNEERTKFGKPSSMTVSEIQYDYAYCHCHRMARIVEFLIIVSSYAFLQFAILHWWFHSSIFDHTASFIPNMRSSLHFINAILGHCSLTKHKGNRQL